ncbi:hypothetical protein Leryth_014290 [Lithospermum erythrorhizon]|nr:hypothetical protein Leryth_014290 [Lithospermum erythrorhizon]
MMANRGSFSHQQQQQSNISAKGYDDLYMELWKACAGPLVDVPRATERVYYFPQGHMEQLEASTNQELGQRIPMFNLSSKILCSVVDIRLLAEKDTDEVYAQITLMPEPDQAEPKSPDTCLPEPPKQTVYSFCKILTASDTSTHGGFSVLRKHATECLPPLDMTQQIPTQELVAKDLHGIDWQFKHIFRDNHLRFLTEHWKTGQPRRHLLTTGWSTFVTSKRLIAGDTFVFLRGENGELRVGVRRQGRQQSSLPSSVISSHSMHIGVLATASHAVTTGTIFVVYYKPRTSQFIIGLNKYLESVNHGFGLGMRFKMRFEGEDSPERRFTGTIIGVEDISSQWNDSRWRSLKVQWDEPASILRPERVSPWEIEPFVASIPTSLGPPATMKNKRPRPQIDVPVVHEFVQSDVSSFWNAPHHSTILNGTLKGQKNEHNVSLQVRQVNDSSALTNSGSNCTPKARLDGDWFSGPNVSASVNMSVNMFVHDTEEGKSITGWSFSPNALEYVEHKTHHSPQLNSEKKPENVASCRLFGIDLNMASPIVHIEKAALEPVIIPANVSDGCLPNTPTGGSDKSDLSRESRDQKQGQLQAPPNEVPPKQNSSTRSRTKVQMQGVAVGRAVDLNVLKGYDELLKELEEMFEIPGELQRRKKWEIVFTDDEGDMMLMGDDPWIEFCNMVRRIFICSSQDVKTMCAGNKVPLTFGDNLEASLISAENGED